MSSLVLGFLCLSSLPHAFFKSPFINLSEVEFSTMLREMPSVDITRSLYPFLFAALINCFAFLDFSTSVSSLSRISKSSFSSGVSLCLQLHHHSLCCQLSPLPFMANSCHPSFVLLNLYTLMLFR